jgi:hypothetical protein
MAAKRTPEHRTHFQTPFSSTQAVHDLIGRHRVEDESAKIKDTEMLAAGKKLRHTVDAQEMRQSFRLIYQWKLQSFTRFAWVKAFPDDIPDCVLRGAVASVLKASPSDEESVRDALLKLDEIRGVGIPVASAFLTAIHPNRFTIMDRQAYKALCARFRGGVEEYLRYLKYCREQADKLGVTLREHDEALWQYGVEKKQRRRSIAVDSSCAC